MTDPTLFKLGPATGGLTDKQQTVLHMLQNEPSGLLALDIGVALHTEDGCQYCTPTRACKYAHTNATSILKALRRKGLAVHRKTGKWTALVRAPEGSGELPEGF